MEGGNILCSKLFQVMSKYQDNKETPLNAAFWCILGLASGNSNFCIPPKPMLICFGQGSFSGNSGQKKDYSCNNNCY